MMVCSIYVVRAMSQYAARTYDITSMSFTISQGRTNGRCVHRRLGADRYIVPLGGGIEPA